MNIEELVKRARAANGAAFGNVNDKRAAKILRAAFRQVTGQIETTDDGKVVVKGLGRFVVKNVEREKDGVKVAKKRVIFRPGNFGASANDEAGKQ